MVWRCQPVLPGCRWFHILQPISIRQVAVRFPRCAGGHRLDELQFCPWFVDVVNAWKCFVMLAPRAPANQRTESRIDVLTP